jgi:hypothetical protein
MPVRVAVLLAALWVTAPAAWPPRAADRTPGEAPKDGPRGAPGAGSLAWPLDRAREVVSTFGEYRYDHLHGGVDISTGGAVGLPVRAVADGAVYRIKVEWRGYGRALYLKLDDGRRVVYGHLQAYDDQTLGLERLVAKRREAAGRFPGDIAIEPPRRVRRGQIVAWSGESGVGLPHLHLEVRDADDHPIDPFESGLPRPARGAPPVLESIQVTAAAKDSWIAGGLRRKGFPLRARGDALETEEPLRVSGPFEASLVAWDPSGGGHAGLQAVEVTVDGAEWYRLAPRRFGFEAGPQAGLVFDHRDSHLGPTRMAYRLGRLPGNDLGSGSGGVFDLPAGEHRIGIVARTVSGSERRALLRVTVGPEGAPPPGVGGTDPAAPPPGAGAREAYGFEALPRFLDLRRPAGLVAASAAAPAAGLLPLCREAEQAAWRRLPDGRLGAGIDYVDLDLDEGGDEAASCRLLRTPGLLAIRQATPDRGLHLDGDRFHLDLPAGARFFPGPIALATLPARDVPDGLAAVGPAIDLLPAGEALSARATLAFDAPPGEAVQKLGIYRWDAIGHRWDFEGSTIDPSGRPALSFRRYGRLALLRDDAAPHLDDLRPKAGAIVGRTPLLQARVEDTGTGLDWDGVRFVLDGRPLVSEFDPDRDLSRVVEAAPLPPGHHRLEVTAVDRAGNVSPAARVDFEVR